MESQAEATGALLRVCATHASDWQREGVSAVERLVYRIPTRHYHLPLPAKSKPLATMELFLALMLPKPATDRSDNDRQSIIDCKRRQGRRCRAKRNCRRLEQQGKSKGVTRASSIFDHHLSIMSNPARIRLPLGPSILPSILPSAIQSANLSFYQSIDPSIELYSVCAKSGWMPSCANFISLGPNQVKLRSMDQHPKTDRILAEILKGLHAAAFLLMAAKSGGRTMCWPLLSCH